MVPVLVVRKSVVPNPAGPPLGALFSFYVLLSPSCVCVRVFYYGHAPYGYGPVPCAS